MQEASEIGKCCDTKIDCPSDERYLNRSQRASATISLRPDG
jgi:hypothetical protein